MVLESTMICLDNSDWMRNGDYLPTRLDAQQDAAGMLCNDRLNSNPENTVGVLTMAGQGVDMLASPTEESGKILAAFARVKIGGTVDLITSIQIAQLALKHRKNKNGGQRIVVFVGGQLFEPVEALVKLGKQLKKNNVSIDIICLGENDENTPKLQELVNTTNTNDNSHLLIIPPGGSPANSLLSSPIMYGGASFGGMGNMGMSDQDFDLYGGVDPALDPELAMAMRISTEEARAQEEARLKAVQDQSNSSTNPDVSHLPDNANMMAVEDEDDEEAMMRRALELSMKDFEAPTSSSGPSANTNTVSKEPFAFEDNEDEELQRALALSMEQSAADAASSASGSSAPQQSSSTIGFVDPAFVSQLLGDVDPNDPNIQETIAQLLAQQGSNEKDNETKSKKRKSDEQEK